MMSPVITDISIPRRRPDIGRSAFRGAAVALTALAIIASSCASDDGGSSGGPAASEVADDVPASAAEDPATSEVVASDASESDSKDSDASDGDADGGDAPAVTVEPSEYISIAAEVGVVSDQPVAVEITATSGDHVVEVPRTAEVGTDHAIPLVGMRAERDYDLEIALFDADGAPVATDTAEFTTGSLPDDFVDYEFTADPERSSPGYTLIEMSPDGLTPYLIALDDEGEVVWYYRNTGVIGGVEPTDRGTFVSHYWPLGIREFDLLGNVVGNWQFQVEGDGGADEDGREEVIDDDLLQQFLDSLEGNPGDPEALPVASDDVSITSFHHEAWPMPNGNILTIGTTFHDLTADQRAAFCPDDETEFGVIGDVIVEFEPSGRVVRTWDLWDAVDIDEVPGDALCGDSGPFASGVGRDWMHVNAVVYDEQRDAIIVSSRHTNQVIALEHGDAEGPQSDVRWIFGQAGTIDVDGEPPYYQHAVEVEEEGSILLYDNGNNRPGTTVSDADAPTYSRAVLYAVDDSSPDPSDWTVTETWEHRTTDADGSVLYARFLGDADRLENGNVLITHGGISLPGDDDFDHALVIEVVPEGDAGGEIVWEFRTGTADQPVTVYRSERIPSFYFGPEWTVGG
jgi:hypothetical protein